MHPQSVPVGLSMPYRNQVDIAPPDFLFIFACRIRALTLKAVCIRGPWIDLLPTHGALGNIGPFLSIFGGWG